MAAARAAQAALLRRREASPDPAGAVEQALGAACGATPPPHLLAAARRIAAAVAAHGEAFAPGAEPAYHNRHHQAEATLAVGWLAGHARAAGELAPAAAALLVVAMAGHDLLHAGRPGAPGELEARSAAATLALAPELAPTEREEVARLIHLTSPVAASAPEDLAGRLMREADLFASLLPELGRRMSAALARELAAAGEGEAARAVASHRGRVALLRHAGAFTAAARAHGLEAARALHFRALTAATGEAAPEAAAARLDALPPDTAEQLWAAALRAAEAAGAAA